MDFDNLGRCALPLNDASDLSRGAFVNRSVPADRKRNSLIAPHPFVIVSTLEAKLQENAHAVSGMLLKATSFDFLGRFREVISDPLNLLIERVPMAGFVDGDQVYLHNGLRVPVAGP